MAKKSKPAAKPIKKANVVSSAKSTAPAKKAMAKKTTPNSPSIKKTTPKPAPAPVKKAVAKAAASKPAPAKKGVKAPVKKATPVKAPSKNTNTIVNKKVTPPAPAKKAAPAKKVAEVKKPAPAKKAAPAKPAPKPAPKPVAKAVAKPVVKSAPAKPAAPAKKAPEKKVALPIRQLPIKPAVPTPRPTATPATRSLDKKPGVIIAHRRMENKMKVASETGNTMINYQPETYRSILDEPQVQQGPAYRYSDEDLNEFREIITSRVDAARKELNYLQGLITRKDEAGTEDTENRYMNMEDGSGAMEREQLAQLASRQIQFMGHLEKALVRIENKTYGICRVTGKLIDKARLRAVPHATLSIDAKKMMAGKQN